MQWPLDFLGKAMPILLFGWAIVLFWIVVGRVTPKAGPKRRKGILLV